jgi:hypothetical protein
MPESMSTLRLEKLRALLDAYGRARRTMTRARRRTCGRTSRGPRSLPNGYASRPTTRRRFFSLTSPTPLGRCRARSSTQPMTSSPRPLRPS